jgi:ribosomal protein S18 acetylase RimI-like enzyme
VAVDESTVVAFAAGHLTTRYACDGELQWINVIPESRGVGVASELLRLIARWFAGNEAFRICVNVDPDNSTARAFYTRHGAKKLNEHWLMWNDISGIIEEK